MITTLALLSLVVLACFVGFDGRVRYLLAAGPTVWAFGTVLDVTSVALAGAIATLPLVLAIAVKLEAWIRTGGG